MYLNMYKVFTKANDHQNLKVDNLRAQNDHKLKFATVEFFSDKLLSVPLGLKSNSIPQNRYPESVANCTQYVTSTFVFIK